MTKRVMLALAAGLLATSCGGGGADDPTVAGDTCAPAGNRVSISADNLEYDKSCLAVPADQDFTISFDNEESLPHNVVLLKDKGSDNSIFAGELITGPEKVDYGVKALPAGTYRFLCSVHPTQMKGTFIVQ